LGEDQIANRAKEMLEQFIQERHQKILYYRQVKKLSIRETADATGYRPLPDMPHSGTGPAIRNGYLG
jgi:hypothetical protein